MKLMVYSKKIAILVFCNFRMCEFWGMRKERKETIAVLIDVARWGEKRRDLILEWFTITITVQCRKRKPEMRRDIVPRDCVKKSGWTLGARPSFIYKQRSRKKFSKWRQWNRGKSTRHSPSTFSPLSLTRSARLPSLSAFLLYPSSVMNEIS